MHWQVAEEEYLYSVTPLHVLTSAAEDHSCLYYETVAPQLGLREGYNLYGWGPASAYPVVQDSSFPSDTFTLASRPNASKATDRGLMHGRSFSSSFCGSQIACLA